MIIFKTAIFGIAILGLAACSGNSSITNDVATAETGYIASLVIYDTYLKSGVAKPAIVTSIEQARAVVSAAIVPVANATAAGNPPSSALLATLQGAITAFQAALVQYGIK